MRRSKWSRARTGRAGELRLQERRRRDVRRLRDRQPRDRALVGDRQPLRRHQRLPDDDDSARRAGFGLRQRRRRGGRGVRRQRRRGLSGSSRAVVYMQPGVFRRRSRHDDDHVDGKNVPVQGEAPRPGPRVREPRSDAGRGPRRQRRQPHRAPRDCRRRHRWGKSAPACGRYLWKRTNAADGLTEVEFLRKTSARGAWWQVQFTGRPPAGSAVPIRGLPMTMTLAVDATCHGDDWQNRRTRRRVAGQAFGRRIGVARSPRRRQTGPILPRTVGSHAVPGTCLCDQETDGGLDLDLCARRRFRMRSRLPSRAGASPIRLTEDGPSSWVCLIGNSRMRRR